MSTFVMFEELQKMVMESVACGETWLFTQNLSDRLEGRQNFQVLGSDATNGNWKGRPSRPYDWIGHWTEIDPNGSPDYRLWVGRSIPGDEGVIPVSGGRYKLRMRNVHSYRVEHIPEGRSRLKLLLGGNQPGTTYTYLDDSEELSVLQKSDNGLPIRGEMEQRLAWHRVNHNRFRDAVHQRFSGRCAVFGATCNGLLIASHIVPWRDANPHERVDVNNGLLLAAPLDALFDRGLISFQDDGRMLCSAILTEDTLNAFGVTPNLRIRLESFDGAATIPKEMCEYLNRHRKIFSFT